ncbi:EAL domain-containing protein [Butyrivibrio sp. VCB2006]|uniref:EAL domain-containing protein n=1 Tax=Butyrivibrio sp. VCB2006 TaxID=1280679 RepID=UPI000406865C|nr:EAL domain-containing protein [Butyrivibrio sp. VCB2006]
MKDTTIYSVKRITFTRCRRVAALLLCAALLFVAVVSLCSLPGVSSFAKENEGKVVRVGWYESPYCYTDRFGRRTGMAYEYQQKIATYTGWAYEYVTGTWPQLLEMLLNGEIDILSDVSYMPERQDFIWFSSLPMGTESYYMFVKAGNEEMTLDDLSTFQGKKVLVDRGSIQENLVRQWAAQNNIEIEIIENVVSSPDICIGWLNHGDVDIYVTLDTYGSSEICSPVCKIGSSDFYFGVNKERSDLLKEINHAMTKIQNEDPFYNQRVYQKYIWSVNSTSYLTEEELNWLEKHGTIRVGYRDNYMPFCESGDDGLTGALGDFLDRASVSMRNTEINFEAIPYKTTEESLEALDRGEIDVVFPVSMGPYDSEKADLFTTDSIMDTEIYAVVKTRGKDIFEKKVNTVALLAGNINFDNFVKDYFPDWMIVWYPTLDEVYAAVARGNADCAMVNGNRINKTDALRRQYNLSLLSTGEEMGFSFGVKRKNGTLLAIMNNAVNRIPEASIDAMLSKYANQAEKVSFADYLNDNLPSVIAMVAVVASLILFLLLLKMRSDKAASDRQKLIAATERDSLTKLYTRNFFFEYAKEKFDGNPDKRFDAMVMNIEQFHVINALYGWNFGDTVLKALGDEISKYVKENNGIACRSQADRFDVYASTTGDYQSIYQRFQDRLDKCATNVNIRLRMGVMPWQKDIEPVQLFDRARTACSMIRGGYHNRVMVFSEEMREREILENRLIIDLKRAIDNHEFLVYFQPKFDIQADPPKLYSAEALVRWEHPELGMIPPGSFISVYEKSGHIGALDKYVWLETAKQIADWKKRLGITLPVSVNLSRIDIFDPEIVDTIDNLVEECGIDRADLHLEVTESAYTENEDVVIGVIKVFREKGYHIEMDDFGTGYSSLNMLSHMPIDVLKLDRSFIKDIGVNNSDDKDSRMVELILDIAKSLKLLVVAEGVETQTQLQFLKERGCEFIQGYYFSPPLSAAEFENKFLK